LIAAIFPIRPERIAARTTAGVGVNYLLLFDIPNNTYALAGNGTDEISI